MYYLEIKDVTKRYTNHLALDGISIQIPHNSIYGLLGPNGAGKTTTIRIINQITIPDSGSVLLNGEPLKPEDVHRIGYLPEERGLYKKMQVGELVIYLARLKGLSKKEAVARMDQWFDKFEISAWKNKKVEELSKGMQQKIQFITTVIHNPQLIILDEPFSGFDPVNAELLKKEIYELKANGATIILSTHNMESVEELCEEISLINNAKVVLQGKVDEIRQRFKKQLFRVVVAEDHVKEDPERYTILECKAVHNGTEALIRLVDHLSNNEVITTLAKAHTLNLFEELLPSMQEVFIETVTKPIEKARV